MGACSGAEGGKVVFTMLWHWGLELGNHVSGRGGGEMGKGESIPFQLIEGSNRKEWNKGLHITGDGEMIGWKWSEARERSDGLRWHGSEKVIRRGAWEWV